MSNLDTRLADLEHRLDMLTQFLGEIALGYRAPSEHQMQAAKSLVGRASLAADWLAERRNPDAARIAQMAANASSLLDATVH